jgi:hypothetical protein
MAEIKNPLFIVGSPRSGTTVLGRLLGRHPELVEVREPRLIWKFGNDNKSDLLTTSDLNPRIKKYIRSKLAEKAPAEKGLRLLDKSPNNALRIPFILEIFPDAKFIHIIRNGYDVSLSIKGFWENKTSGLDYKRVETGESILMQRLKEIHWTQLPYYAGEFLNRFLSKIGFNRIVPWGTRIPGLKSMMSELSIIEISALQWKYSVEVACYEGRKLPEDTYREIRLNELTYETLEELLEFAGLANFDEIKEYFDSTFDKKRTIEKQKNYSNEEVERIKKWIEPTSVWIDTLQ